MSTNQGTSYRHERQVVTRPVTSDARGLNHSWEEIQEAIVKIEGRKMSVHMSL